MVRARESGAGLGEGDVDDARSSGRLRAGGRHANGTCDGLETSGARGWGRNCGRDWFPMAAWWDESGAGLARWQGRGLLS